MPICEMLEDGLIEVKVGGKMFSYGIKHPIPSTSPATLLQVTLEGGRMFWLMARLNIGVVETVWLNIGLMAVVVESGLKDLGATVQMG